MESREYNYTIRGWVKQKYNSKTHLIQSCENGYLDIVKYLVRMGIDPDYECLNFAVRNGYIDICKFLLNRDPEINPYLLDQLFITGVEWNQVEMIKFLLTRYPNHRFDSTTLDLSVRKGFIGLLRTIYPYRSYLVQYIQTYRDYIKCVADYSDDGIIYCFQ